MDSATQRATVFLDRDGTINREVAYLSDPDQLELLSGVSDGLRRLQERGCRLIVVTNQSAVGRGILDEARLAEIHARLDAMLRAEGVEIAAWYWCPHVSEDHCDCRKPQVGMFEEAGRRYALNPEATWVIGDKLSDMEAGRRFLAKTILVATGYGQEQWIRPNSRDWTDFFVPSLDAAAELILRAEQVRCNDRSESRAYNDPER